jgi:trans-aconitate 2-methyltransferase
MEWNPKQYEKFTAAREAPFFDLIALIHRRPHMSVVDLGCGTGNLSEKLANALPDADVLGLDSSPAMLESAAARARPGLRFADGRIEDFAGAGGADYDLIFSHSALHWASDHARLIPRLLARLKPGGQLAVQLPADDDSPARVVFADAAGWRHELGTLDIAQYAELLYAQDVADMTVYEKVYPHVLHNADAVLEWARGTALLPYLQRLPPAQHGPYLDEVRRRLLACYPGSPVFFPFRRIIFWARRA